MNSDCIKVSLHLATLPICSQEPWLVASFPDEIEIYSKDNEKPTKEY